MKEQRAYPSVILTRKGEKALRNGHPWVYREEILTDCTDFPNGCLTDVFSDKQSYLGTGFYSEKSKIAIRILSDNANERFDEAFWQRRIQYALDYRKTVMGADIASCRLIFGEADGFPGFTVDRFEDILVTQVLSYGMEKIKDLLYHQLWEQLNKIPQTIHGIYERNDVSLRKLEGLTEYCGWYEELPHPASTITEITENDIRYLVDFAKGQKTGYFLDQKFNRQAVARLAQNRIVLDCFTHTGSFALNAAKGGATHVTAADASSYALTMAKQHAEMNGLTDKMDFVCADIFELLPRLQKESPYAYDFIILDPPAFTKSRKTMEQAERGYHEINQRAMQLLPKGGYLATCSCSHFMSRERFENMLNKAAHDAKVRLKQIEFRQQAMDHPILWNVPETDYLKFYLFQIVS